MWREICGPAAHQQQEQWKIIRPAPTKYGWNLMIYTVPGIYQWQKNILFTWILILGRGSRRWTASSTHWHAASSSDVRGCSTRSMKFGSQLTILFGKTKETACTDWNDLSSWSECFFRLKVGRVELEACDWFYIYIPLRVAPYIGRTPQSTHKNLSLSICY